MKSLKQIINESKFASDAKNCKTFKDFFYIYTGYDDINELDEKDYNQFDYGYVFYGDDIELEDFVEWYNTIKNKKITKMKVDDKYNRVTFNVGKYEFDLDFISDEWR